MSKTIADPTLLATHMAELADKRIDILRRIGDVGSISEAARRAGVSYKAAWQAIETLNNLAGAPLVEKVVGGNKDSPALKNVGVSSLRTSMRNQFPAVIEKLKIGSAQVRLILSIDDTHYIRASCTKESAQLLGLREGKHVLALCKATAVDISADNPALVESRDNQIVGAVLRSEREDKGGECTIQLPSGLTIVGFARPSHGLHIGMRAVATVAPEAVVIALNS